MAYTICDDVGNPKPLRLIVTDMHDKPKLGAAFRPYWWTCDPCNPSRARYEVEFRCDQDKPTEYPWYQVVTTDDSGRYRVQVGALRTRYRGAQGGGCRSARVRTTEWREVR